MNAAHVLIIAALATVIVALLVILFRALLRAIEP